MYYFDVTIFVSLEIMQPSSFLLFSFILDCAIFKSRSHELETWERSKFSYFICYLTYFFFLLDWFLQRKGTNHVKDESGFVADLFELYLFRFFWTKKEKKDKYVKTNKKVRSYFPECFDFHQQIIPFFVMFLSDI